MHLADVHHCGDASKFVSVVLLSLTAMVRLELPHVNVLSKVDLVGGGGGGAAAAGARRRGDRSSSDDEDEGEDEGSGTGGGGGGARPAGGGLGERESASLLTFSCASSLPPVSLAPPDFDLDYYTDAQDLHQLTALIRGQSGLADDDGGGGGGGAAGAPPGGPQRRRRFMERWARLNDKLVEIIEDHCEGRGRPALVAAPTSHHPAPSQRSCLSSRCPSRYGRRRSASPCCRPHNHARPLPWWGCSTPRASSK